MTPKIALPVHLCLLAILGVMGGPARADDAATTAAARQILDATGVQGGLIVQLGCGDGELAAALHDRSPSLLVQGLERDPAKVSQARQRLLARGLYGPVTVEQFSGARLPYIDNLVNLLVADDLQGVPMAEALRVLVTNGVAYVKQGGKWTKTIKPRPADMDQWTHYLHDPSNNAVAHDALVGPPRRLQWTSGPAWSRHHDHMASLSAMVSANGRVFYIMDEGPREAILLPSKWELIARDAFNGTLLWKREIPQWNTQLWPLKSGPNQLPRRLVAVGDRVYVTLGIDAPVSALDAATGRTVQTYASTSETDEILNADGVLYLLVAESPNKWKDYRPKFTYVWDNTRRANSEWAWDREKRWLMAIRADTGAVVWKQEQRVAPLTLGVSGQRLYWYDGEKVVCADRDNGTQIWASEPVLRKSPFPTGYGPTLVIQQGVVLLSIENRSMTAFSAADGKTLWTAPHHPAGHMSPDDLLVIGGLVWSGAIANGADSGVFTGRDLETGEVKSEFKPDVNPPWFHHRCYRSRATDKYFIASRTGIEFIDLKAQHWDINHWVRGGCLYGFMPCNGLLYTPPHSCGCFLESKLFGLNALATANPADDQPAPTDQPRLEKGPAYAAPSSAASSQSPIPNPQSLSSDWPTYRRDGMRSGSTPTAIAADLKRTWQAELGGKLSSLTIAGGHVYVAAIAAHTIYALDADSGKVDWSYTVGGRVDSPPTVHGNSVLFGSADGWVYCLRADDGQLAWRFRAAANAAQLVADGQLESAWPVSGSVLVHDGGVYCVAGRSAFLDGGMCLLRLDAASGRLLSETRIDDRDPNTGENLQADMKAQDMPVALPDILSCDGRSIYMRTQAFDLAGSRRVIDPIRLDRPRARRNAAAAESDVPAEVADHLFSRTGFLDDSWFFRSYWMFGKSVDGNYGGWLRPGHFAPCGRLLVFDDKSVYGFDRKPEYLCNASVQEYYLYGADRAVSDESLDRVRAATNRINASSSSKQASSSDWFVRQKFPLTDQNPVTYHWAAGSLPIQAHALVLAGQTLLVAGPPDVLDEQQAFRNYDDPAVQAKLAEQAAALRGELGGQLLLFSIADGKPLAAYQLGAMPTFDGMAVAEGKVYLSTVDGKVLCLGAAGTPLPTAAPAAVAPLDIAVKPAPPVVEPALGPSAKGDFAKLVGGTVTRCELGYHLRAEAKKNGLALKKLPEPLKGTVTLKLRLKSTDDGAIRNGFLAFGDEPDEARLVKCGLRMLMNKAVIVDGPLSGKAVEHEIDLDALKTYDIEVTVELDAGRVTMRTGNATFNAKLAHPPASVTYVGYAVLNAAADFSPIETTAK